MDCTNLNLSSKPNFGKSVIEYLYKCMGERKFTDVDFNLRGKTIYAHKNVLAASSEFFRGDLSQLSEVLNPYEDEVIDAILKYCYTGELCIDLKHIEKFGELAKTLKINYIDDVISNLGNQQINSTNSLMFLRLSSLNPDWKKTAMNITTENFSSLYQTATFLRLPLAMVIDILKSDDLNVSEEEVFKAIKLWINHDESNRRANLFELLSTVRLTLLSLEFLTSEILAYCYSSPPSVIIINTAMQTLLSPNAQNSLKTQNYRTGSHQLILVGSDYYDQQQTLEIYNEKQNTWSVSKNYEFARNFYVPVLVNDWIIIVGGWPNNRDLVDYIDLKDGQKHSLEKLKDGRYDLAAVALKKGLSTDVYAIGGLTAAGATTKVERWNSERKTWETDVAPLLTATFAHDASVLNNRIYVTGGVAPAVSNIVQMYTPETNTWTFRAPMIKTRCDHMNASIKGKLYAVGGSTLYYNHPYYISDVERYDPNANLWSPFCNLPSPRAGTSLCYFKGRFLFSGGRDNKGAMLREILEYDDKNNSFAHFSSISSNRVKAFPIFVKTKSVL
ncbi:kelch-like protein 25 [Arctopsyche grandis]|uniref:kelch-like protein 25 n=1 Tax=Arctopsyche grandis TaxID=121162 RepID=UPI00406D8564